VQTDNSDDQLLFTLYDKMFNSKKLPRYQQTRGMQTIAPDPHEARRRSKVAGERQACEQTCLIGHRPAESRNQQRLRGAKWGRLMEREGGVARGNRRLPIKIY